MPVHTVDKTELEDAVSRLEAGGEVVVQLLREQNKWLIITKPSLANDTGRPWAPRGSYEQRDAS